ncbi:uncharacterized protein PpBr36_10546 [Pyricularia pennisetigena]|uniref:uncharacterized protein n=1 Tax=Pyricularia pennisetigena TaxID=1578925 RepID=UPI00114DE234|nr:uncharacterized protein PpBr36_10546 [Pyricularia pennisetigena]TLS21258.1 hypothetical protein PpBr36_10546 [Pyricularia pennisetigena]
MVKLNRGQFRDTPYVDFLEERLKVAIERAWIKLRFCHPGIAATVSRDVITDTLLRSFLRISGTDPSRIPDWVAATFASGPNEESIASMQGSLDSCHLSALIPDPDPHREALEIQLILRSPAWLIDTNGCLGLLNAVVMFAANDLRRPTPEFLDWETRENNVDHLRADRVPVLDSSHTCRPLGHGKQPPAPLPPGFVASEFPSHLSFLPDVLLGPESIVPANRYIELDEIDSILLVANLSALGRTVSQAFHAAMILVSRDWQNRHLLPGLDAQVVRYRSHITCDKRPFVPRRVQDPASVHHRLSDKCLVVDVRSSTDLPVLVPEWPDGPPPGIISLNGPLGRVGTLIFNCPGTDASRAEQKEFLIVMSQIKKFYGEVKAEPDLRPEPLEDADAVDSDVVTFLERSDQKPMLVFIPGMNNIDSIMRTNIGSLHIERPVITRSVLNRDVVMSVMVHENRMTFSASWNSYWHTEGRVQEVMNNCVDKVFRCLGLQVPIPPANAAIQIEPEVPEVIPGRQWIVPPIREILGPYF